MATLAQLYAEHRARARRLKEAVDNGFHDCIPSERECLAEIEHELLKNLLSPAVSDQIVAVAGDIECGTLTAGVSLAYTRSQS